MVLKMYCIYDIKQEIHHPPLLAHNVGHALRVFGDIFNTPGQVFNNHPADFQVYSIGVYDDQTAEILPEKRHLIAVGNELIIHPTPEV